MMAKDPLTQGIADSRYLRIDSAAVGQTIRGTGTIVSNAYNWTFLDGNVTLSAGQLAGTSDSGSIAATFVGTAAVAGSFQRTTAGTAFQVGDNITLTNFTVTAAGAGQFASTLGVTGAATLSSTLSVTGTATLAAATAINMSGTGTNTVTSASAGATTAFVNNATSTATSIAAWQDGGVTRMSLSAGSTAKLIMRTDLSYGNTSAIAVRDTFGQFAQGIGLECNAASHPQARAFILIDQRADNIAYLGSAAISVWPDTGAPTIEIFPNRVVSGSYTASIRNSKTTDAASVSLFDFGAFNAITAGTDRYLARFYRDNFTNVQLSITSNGSLIFATGPTLQSGAATGANTGFAFTLLNSPTTFATFGSNATIPGAAPESVAGAGTAAINGSLNGAVGGATSGTTGQTAGTGSTMTLTGGAGGAASGLTGANIAGAGGGVTLTPGAGGAVTSATGTAGAGGAITGTAGAGSGTGATGGAGGAVSLTAGAGGNGTTTGGVGGTVTIISGASGTGGSPTAAAVIFRTNTNSTAAFRFQNASSTVVASIDTTNARMRIGDGIAPTQTLDILGQTTIASTGATSINATTGATPLTVQGAGVTRATIAESGLVTNTIAGTASGTGTASVIQSSFGVATATTTVTNTTTTTNLFTAEEGANTLRAARNVRIKAWGTISTAGTPGTITMRVLREAVVLASTGAQTPTASMTDRGWSLEFDSACRTVGGTGTAFSQGRFTFSTSATDIAGYDMENTATSTIDTTALGTTWIVDFAWGTADVANSISITNAVIEIIN